MASVSSIKAVFKLVLSRSIVLWALEIFRKELLNPRNMSRSANQDNFVNAGLVHFRIAENPVNFVLTRSEEILAELLKLGTCERDV